MGKDDTSGLKSLGSKQTNYKYDEPVMEMLETFPNKSPQNNYGIQFTFPEFTSLCPKTGQPDFATISIEYVADEKCIETKSLKMYFFAYRSYGSFMETIVNKILDDCVKACQPKMMFVKGLFNPRGGVGLVVQAKYEKPQSTLTVPRMGMPVTVKG